MPKRTNEFQQLIYLIQAQLEGRGVVTESKLVKDSITGDSVEVDVVVETAVNGFPLCIGIECTSAARPASVEWVREMFGKHDTLPVQSTVLVSKSGFSQAALQLAEGKGLTTLSLTEATDHDWRQYVAGLSHLKMGVFNFKPIGGPRLTLPGREGSQLTQFSVDSPVRIQKTGFEGLLRDVVVSALRKPSAMQSFTKAWLAKPPAERPHAGRGSASLTVNDPTEIWLDSGEWWPVLKIEVEFEFSIVEAPLSLIAASFGDQQIAYGIAPNILHGKEYATQYVLFNMVGQGGVPTKASILVPAKPGEQPTLYNLRLNVEKGPTRGTDATGER